MPAIRDEVLGFMNTDVLLYYAVTALGMALCLSLIVFIFMGKRVPGAGGQAETIKFRGFEANTSSTILMFIISAMMTLAPLYFMHEGDVKRIPELNAERDALMSANKNLIIELERLKTQVVDLTHASSNQIFMNGGVRDEFGKPLEGAVVRVIRTNPSPVAQIKQMGPTQDDGHFLDEVQYRNDKDKLEVRVEKAGYEPQVLTLGKDMVTYPAVLVKKRR